MRHVILASCLLLACLLVACGEESDSSPTSSTPSPDVADDTQMINDDLGRTTADVTEGPGCPKGQIIGFAGTCTTIGIPNCAEQFMSPESEFCEPSIALCDAGHYPDFETGCVQAGITECAPEFIDPASGLCIPSPDACETGFFPVPTQGCVSLDPPGGCGAGTWGDITEAIGDRHVDHAYSGGDSDGSREKPWTQISQALISDDQESRIILAAGDYDESVFLQSSASIIGRCSSMVTLSGASTSPLAANLGKTVLEVAGPANVTVRDVKVSGAGIGLVAYIGAQVNLERVIFDDNEFFGIFINGTGTVVTASDLVVSGTRPRTDDGMFGWGISAQDGGALTLERGMLFGNNDTNLFCGGALGNGPSSLSVKNVLVSRAQAGSTDTGGRGVSVDSGASATLENVVIHENPASGLFAAHAETSIQVDGLVVEGPTAENSEGRARGINIQTEASATLNQVAVLRAEDIGLYIANDGTNLEAKGLYIADTRPTYSQANGRGIHLRDGASLSLEGGALIANHDTGFVVRDNATATVTGLLVENTQPDIYGWGGVGIEVLAGAHLVLERSALLTNIEAGLVSSNVEDPLGSTFNDTLAEIRDSIIAHTQESADGAFGRGIQNQSGGSLVVERCVIIDNHEAAIFIWEAIGEILDTLLADTAVSGHHGLGDGLLVTMSEVTARGVTATRNGRVGVLFDQTGGEISSCSITENFLGLATQGTDVPTISDDNTVVNNTNNLVVNNELQVPDAPMELPDHDSSNE